MRTLRVFKFRAKCAIFLTFVYVSLVNVVVHTATRGRPAGHILRVRAVSLHDRGVAHSHADPALRDEAMRHRGRRVHRAGCAGLHSLPLAEAHWCQVPVRQNAEVLVPANKSRQ